MIMFVIIGGDHPIMVDTGTPDAGFVREHFRYSTFERGDDEEPRKVLNGAGIDPADVRQVVFTHLHWDHCSNLELFPNARFTVQDRELRYAVKPIPLHNRAYQHLPGTQPPWLPVLRRVSPVIGTVEIAPGISTVPLPGHTPGSQGVLVETDKGRYLIAGDCLDSYDNWDSLTILSLITLLDADFGVTMHASDIRQFNSAADLLAGVQAKAAK